METFVGRVPDGKNINHKDGNKENFRLDNLEYISFSENIQHALATGLMIPKCKLTEEQVDFVREMSGLFAQNVIAQVLQISRSKVSNIIIGKRRSRKWRKQDAAKK